ncbi:YbeD family protein [Sedimenticola sp.]|uniref:YbeD family protein n=1 Tax=Sedimenticola sp. TaxID=1940285 RepID=UPI003D0DA2E3
MSEQKDTLLEFPCEFSVKAMGLSSHPDFEALVVEIVSVHVPDLAQDASRSRSSKNGKYLSVTVTFQATSKAQLDAIYYDLTGHQDVVMSL